MWNIRSVVLADAALADGDGVDNADAAFGDRVADAALAAIFACIGWGCRVTRANLVPQFFLSRPKHNILLGLFNMPYRVFFSACAYWLPFSGAWPPF